MRDRHRQLVLAALTANALHPVPGRRAAVPAMVAGWLTSELAPHLLATTASDTLLQLARGRRDERGIALSAASAAGLAHLIRQSAAAKGDVDRALVEALGPDYMDRLGAVPTDLDMATPWRQLVMPFRMQNPEVEVLKDITYTDYGRRGLLDVYRRRDAPVDGAPVLLQVHGGGWTIGSDPSYVAITGGSAGGHLAALAALTPNDPEYQPGFEHADTTLQAAVPHYGVYDFAGATGDRRSVALRDSFLGPRVLRRSAAEHLADFERASPLLRVRPDAPPFFVIHGTHDSLVPVDQARQFVRRLREVSRSPVAYAELPGTQHAFDVFPSIRSAHVVRGVDRFLRFAYASRS